MNAPNLGATLARETVRTRGRYTGSLLDLARYTLRTGDIASMRAEVDALDRDLDRVRRILAGEKETRPGRKRKP